MLHSDSRMFQETQSASEELISLSHANAVRARHETFWYITLTAPVCNRTLTRNSETPTYVRKLHGDYRVLHEAQHAAAAITSIGHVANAEASILGYRQGVGERLAGGGRVEIATC